MANFWIYFRRANRFNIFFILAKLLSPADFGIVAFVLLVPKFLQNATETGFSAAAIQKQGHIKQYLNPMWTIGVLKSIIIFTFTIFAGPKIALFFHVEHATLAIQMGGIFIIIQHLSNVGEVYLFKNLDFKKIFIRNISKQIAYVVTSVTAVLVFKSYWALIIGNLALYTTQTVSTYILHPYRPKLTLKFNNLKNLFGYSKWIVGQSWLTQMYSFMESTLIGHLTNVNSMGLYSKGKNLAAVIPGFLSSTINTVSFPAYSKLKNTTKKIKGGVQKSFDLFFFFTVPTAFLIIFAGQKLIFMLIGEQWVPMSNVFKLLFIFFTINLITEITYAVFNAVGKPDKKVKLEMIKIPTTLLLLFFLTREFGINGSALALILGSIPIFFISFHYLVKETGILYKDFFISFLIPFVLSFLLGLPIYALKDTILKTDLITFSGIILLLGVTYIYLITIIGKKYNQGPYTTLNLLKKYIK